MKQTRKFPKAGYWLLGIGIMMCIALGAYHIHISAEFSDIVDRFYSEYEGIVDEVEKVHAIREYVYKYSVFANGEDVLLNGFSHEIFGLTKKEKVVKMFALRNNFKGGLYCDGFADMLTMFYQLLGYDAYRINLDVYGNTHCLTAVKCADEWLLEDPTFNYCFIAEGAGGIDNIYRILESGRKDGVSIVEGEIKQTYAISFSEPKDWSSLYSIISFVDKKHKKNMYLIDRGVSNYAMYDLMYPYFIEDGYGAHFKYSLLYADDVIWKYGLEDLLFNRKKILSDVAQLEEQLHIGAGR